MRTPEEILEFCRRLEVKHRRSAFHWDYSGEGPDSPGERQETAKAEIAAAVIAFIQGELD